MWQVETSRGEFTFNKGIRWASALELFARFAPEACKRGLTPEPGPSEDLWPEAAHGRQQVFHFRARSNRAPLAIPLTYALSPLWIWLMGLPGRPWGLTVVCGLVWAWFLWGYLAVRVETDEYGITLHNRRGHRLLEWRHVTGYGSRGEPTQGFVWDYVQSGDDRFYWWFGILHCEALRDEIARRAPHGVTGRWIRPPQRN